MEDYFLILDLLFKLSHRKNYIFIGVCYYAEDVSPAERILL